MKGVAQAFVLVISLVGLAILAITLGSASPNEVIDNFANTNTPEKATVVAKNTTEQKPVAPQPTAVPITKKTNTSSATPPASTPTVATVTTDTNVYGPIDDQDSGGYTTIEVGKPTKETKVTTTKQGDGPTTPAVPVTVTKNEKPEAPANDMCKEFIKSLSEDQQKKAIGLKDCSPINTNANSGIDKYVTDALKVPELEKKNKELENELSKTKTAKEKAEKSAKELADKLDKLTSQAPQKICYETEEVILIGQINTSEGIKKFPFKGKQQKEVSCDKKQTLPPLPPGATIQPAPKK